VQSAFGLKSQYPEMKDVKVGHAHFALRMALKEVKRVKDSGLTQEEFDLTKKFLKSYMKLYIQTPEKRLGFLLDSKFYGSKDYIMEMDEALEKLTLAQVKEAAAKYLQIDNMYVTMIADDQEVEHLKESLMTNAASPMNYSKAVKESLTEEIFKQDKEVENYKLNVKSVSIVKPEETFVK
jgi:zinc protease